MRRTSVVLAALAVSVLAGAPGQALADELCFTALTGQRFHLQITGTTTTSVGSVMSLAGVNHLSGDVDLRSPVTGTLFVEPDTGHFRVSLLDMNGLGLGSNLLWNARLGAVPADEEGTVFSG